MQLIQFNFDTNEMFNSRLVDSLPNCVKAHIVVAVETTQTNIKFYKT